MNVGRWIVLYDILYVYMFGGVDKIIKNIVNVGHWVDLLDMCMYVR